MNKKIAYQEGMQHGTFYLNHMSVMVGFTLKTEYEQQGIAMSNSLCEYRSTRERFLKGWNRRWIDLHGEEK